MVAGMELRVDGEGTWMLPNGGEWIRCQAGVMVAYRTMEVFIPAESVIEHTDEVLRATVEGAVCSWDLRDFASATITREGDMFVCRSKVVPNYSLAVRAEPLAVDWPFPNWPER